MIQTVERPRVRTPGDIDAAISERIRIEKETEERIDNMRPQSPDRSGIGVRDKLMQLALRSPYRVYKAPSGHWFLEGADQMIESEFELLALDRINIWRARAMAEGREILID